MNGIVQTKTYRVCSPVIHGFQRGSKLLGFPTANLEPACFQDAFVGAPRGVYIGFANVDRGEVYKTAVTLGTNPHFNTTTETVEPYILHEFKEDFYGSELRLLICGYLRPSLAYTTLEALIEAIQRDVRVADHVLETQPYANFKNDPFFTDPNVAPPARGENTTSNPTPSTL